MNAEIELTPVIILTGFLGSGKTTLLQRLLTHSFMTGTAVIINEYGEIGIDHLLVQPQVFEPIMLSNGCLCCTLSQGLSASLQRLASSNVSAGIQRVIVETTGLANPIPMLQTLIADRGLGGNFRVGGVISMVDCLNAEATLLAYEEAVCQIAVADLLLITKTDLASPELVANVRDRILQINPRVPALEAIMGDVDLVHFDRLGLHDASLAGNVARWLGLGFEERLESVRAQHQRIQTFHVVLDRPVSWGAFVRWIDTLCRTRGDDILRVKGILNLDETPDEPVVFHGVQNVFHPPEHLPAWPDDDRRTRIVFVTRDLQREAVNATLHLLGAG